MNNELTEYYFRVKGRIIGRTQMEAYEELLERLKEFELIGLGVTIADDDDD
jgi:hypothetical protein